MAKQHELFRRWPQAETILLSYYGDKIDEPYAARRLAEFYLVWGEQDPAVRDKAAVHINQILRGASEGKLTQDDPMVAWARRQAARILARNGNYQDSLKAERLLQAAIAGQAATAEDQGQLVEILTLRGDPASLDRAVKILRQMQEIGSLAPQGELKLGQALFDLRDWAAARAQMQDAISRHPDDPALRVALINMMIQKKDFKAAELWIARLANVEAAARSAPELRLRLAAARGQMDQVRTILTQMTPTSGALTEQQLKNLEVISNLADVVGDHEYALQVMREYARRVPGNELKLARLIALYGDLDEGLTAIKQVFPTNIDDSLRLAVEMLRARRAEDPARLDEEVNSLVRQARHDDPDSARRMVLASEVMEIQERYDDAVAAYNELLARDDVPSMIRATALNNLAFLLTLNKIDLDRALTMVNEAVDIVGPISDILDTRGIVYHAQGDHAKAVADLKLSVMITPTASKYFHLAAAQLAAGDKQGALDAWEQAEEQGIAPEKVSKLEWDDLKQFQKEIEAVRSSTAQL
jgi:tetratricopeptide (TPR) repeat protein